MSHVCLHTRYERRVTEQQELRMPEFYPILLKTESLDNAILAF